MNIFWFSLRVCLQEEAIKKEYNFQGGISRIYQKRWTFSAEPATKVGHPAPFPVELPYRLIQLYTFEEDVILDPFIGSGQAAIAAIKTKRHYVGYDINEEYVKLAERRTRGFVMEFKSQKLLNFSKVNI